MKVTRAGVDRSSTYLPDELPLISVIKNAWDGTAGLGAAPSPDAAGNQEPTEGEQLLLEVGATTILDGFVGAVTSARGSATIGVRRVHTIDIGDDNALLQGHATPGWVRPAESPAARWAAFVTAFLPGSIDTTWLLTTHESGVVLPKNTYRSDSLFDDISADAIRATGKTVYIEGRRFHWHLPTEGQTCSLTIHDTTYNLSTSFPPLSVQRQKDGMDLRNKIYARNDAGTVVSVTDATSVTAHDAAGLKHEGYTEYGADTATDMTRDIGVTLAERKDERVTWTYEIGPLTAAQAAALIPGSQMTVTVGLHDLSAAVKRIASVKLTYKHPDTFMATVELGYPKRFRRKPTKTQANTSGGSGGTGQGGSTAPGGDCGCGPFSGSRCCIDFNINAAGTLNPNVLVTTTAWAADTGSNVNGGEAHVPTASNPYLGVIMSPPYEVLIRSRFTRGIAGVTLAIAQDIFALATFLPGSISGLGVGDFIYAGFRVDHGNHGLVTSTQVDLVMQDAGGAVQRVNVAGTLPAELMLRFRVEEDPAHPGPTGQSIIMSKAWDASAAEPGAWMLTAPSTWNHSGTPGQAGPTDLFVLDNRTGATDTVWHIDYICFNTGLDCADPMSGQRVPFHVVGTGDGATSTFYTADEYEPGSLEARVNTHPVVVAEASSTSGTLGFNPRSFETVSFSYVKKRPA